MFSMINPKERKVMGNSDKWTVVCVDHFDSTVLSVDLFEDYDSARKYMDKDMQDTYNEMTNATDIAHFGQSVTIYIGDDPEYTWSIRQVNIH
jgi:hypothetical protein